MTDPGANQAATLVIGLIYVGVPIALIVFVWLLRRRKKRSA